MKQIYQFRYYGDKSNNNYPKNLPEDDLVLNNIFKDKHSITQLGIQGRPGTTFYLNGSIYPIILGETGIYEIDLTDTGGFITSIRFSNESLSFYTNTSGNRLLIDIIYEK